LISVFLSIKAQGRKDRGVEQTEHTHTRTYVSRRRISLLLFS
jgi:hypothetical protein